MCSSIAKSIPGSILLNPRLIEESGIVTVKVTVPDSEGFLTINAPKSDRELRLERQQ